MDTYLSKTIHPKDKILNATLKIIATEGVQHVTSRKIAALAEVNVAAINYYYGSKDKVINEAFKIFMQTLMHTFDPLADMSLHPKLRLRNFLRSYADQALQYPDLFRYFVDQLIHETTASLEYIEFMKQAGFHKLSLLLQDLFPQPLTETELIMKMFQMFSSLEFPILIGHHMRNISHFDYADKQCRYQYIDLVLSSLLHTEKSSVD